MKFPKFSLGFCLSWIVLASAAVNVLGVSEPIYDQDHGDGGGAGGGVGGMSNLFSTLGKLGSLNLKEEWAAPRTWGDWGSEEEEEEEEKVGGMNLGGMDVIIELINGAARILKNLPDIRGLVSGVMDKWGREIGRFMNQLPGWIRRMRPEIKQILIDAKSPIREIESRLVKLKKKMMSVSGRKNLIDLDLLERSLSFCPLVNLTRLQLSGSPLALQLGGSRLSWPQFETAMLDQCVRLGCDGKYDLCCPYLDSQPLPGTWAPDTVKTTCVYSQRKHYGSCPSGHKSVYMDQTAILYTLKHKGTCPECSRDSHCKVTERCCMKEKLDNNPKGVASPIASCMTERNLAWHDHGDGGGGDGNWANADWADEDGDRALDFTLGDLGGLEHEET